MYATV
jgi:hydroxypyruvate isomerase